MLFALVLSAGAAIPAPFRGAWATEPAACRSGDARDRFQISAKRFRDARVVSVHPKAPNAVDVTLRIPSGERVRRELVLDDSRSLRVVEEIGIMGYVRCR